MAGSRAAHNWKRRQKLIEKKTGRSYGRGNPNKKWGSDGKWDSWDSHSWVSDGSNRAKKFRAAKKENSQPRAVKPLSIEEKLLGPGVKKAKKKRSKDEHASIPATADDTVKKAKGKKLKVKTAKTGRKLLKKKPLDASEAPKTRGRRLKKKRTSGGDDAGGLVKRKRKKSAASTTDEGETRKLKRKKTKRTAEDDDTASMKATRPLKKALLRRKAFIINPGSVSERMARQDLNDNERKLLRSGDLSWRWLREPEDPSSLKDAPPQPDRASHRESLGQFIDVLPTATAVQRLRQLDECLGTLAFWPPCAARASLAMRLRAKGALHRRCVRHMAEVIEPLLTIASGKNVIAGSAESLASEASVLFLRCAEKWCVQVQNRTTVPPIDLDSAKKAWMHMLSRAITATRGEVPGDGWLRALQIIVFARYCPFPDIDVQQSLLRMVAEALGGALSGNQDIMADDTRRIVMLPLGVFTFWQTLLLVGAARWLGQEATVVRRTASGPAEPFFRSVDAAR